MPYFMTQWYLFTPLTQTELLSIQATLQEIGKNHEMNGLILLATEGCNGTVAGPQEAVKFIKEYLITTFPISNFQDWESDVKPFKRFKVDIRQEIVALKKSDTPTPSSSPSGRGRGADSSPFQGEGGWGEIDHVSPADFHRMLEQDDVTILDTRNTYETAIGTFKNAIIPPLKSFHEFPNYVEKSAIPKDKPVLMFCTSGIRCEKAAEEMRSQGYEKVYQLDGGITNYIKEYPNGHWQGECFMFDHRVAVDKNLQPSKRYALCPSCGNPGDVRTTCIQCNMPCTLCEACLEKVPALCSKACKHNMKYKKMPIV